MGVITIIQINLKISVTLHSYLRELLPLQDKGVANLDLPEGSCIEDVFTLLKLPPKLACAVNGDIEHDHFRVLQDGDALHFFRPAAGG